MSKHDRLKRRLIAEAVRENLDTIHELQERRRRYRKTQLRLWMTRMVLLVSAPVLALGTMGLMGANGFPSFAIDAIPVPEIATRTPMFRDAMPRPPILTTPGGEIDPDAPLPPLSLSPEQEAALLAEAGTPLPIDPAVFPLGIRHVVVDPGHGGTSPGTSDARGLVEKEVTLDIGLKLRDLLQRGGYRVTISRETDASVSLEERAILANRAGGDIFVSIHLNWLDNRTKRGVETYYLGPTDDPRLARLAAIENQDSGYSMADYKGLLERIYLGLRRDESQRLAASVQQALLGQLRKTSPDLVDRGVKTAPFLVLVGTDMPAILAEVSCVSNEREAKMLRDDAYRQKIAEALYQGIRRFSGESSSDTKKGG